MPSAAQSVGRRGRLAWRLVTTWRPTWAWSIGSIRSFVTSFVALTIALWLLPGTQVTDGTVSVATLAVVVLVIAALLRPLLISATVVTGATGLLIAGLLSQALVLGLALALVPTVEPFTLTQIVVASWAATIVSAVVNWLFDASTDEAFFGQVLGRTVSTALREQITGPGLLIIQLDGVSHPLLRQAVTSGATPHLARWLASGSHQLREWDTGLPATTPAGQAALLHGDVHAVPGFRWYDKDLQRVMVSSRPADLTLVESGLSTGRGLLSDGGVSVSNLLSGDAPTRVLTLSDARLPSEQRGVASFMNTRTGFVRSIVLVVGQMIAELHQGRRQRLRQVTPRVRRGGRFVFLRGLTTVVLRDLSVSVVADQMARGAPVLFCDFVDYDEVAHHAGPSRPEAMRTLESLDRIISFFEQIAGEVSRDYEIAVVSDHGQAQGSTFEQLAGRTLSQVVADLCDATDLGAAPPVDETPAENAIPVNLLRQAGSGAGLVLGRGERARDRTPPAPVNAASDAPLVLSSGSLAHLYLTAEPGRVTRERIDELHPELVLGLARQPHVGVVLTRHADGVLRVDGPLGWRLLRDGHSVGGEGDDPLTIFGEGAAAALIGLDARAHVGDLVVLGAVDATLGGVAAFENLVGSHGGLGGWQNRALLIHPHAWAVPARPLDGPGVHRVLVERLEQLGLREEPLERDSDPGSESGPRSLASTPRAGPGALHVTWWGHSTATVEIGATRIVTDPLLVDRLAHLRRTAPAPAASATAADLVLISHLHHDHLHVASLERFEREIPVVVPRGALAAVPALRLRHCVEVEPGDTLEVAGVWLEVLPAAHDGRRHPWSRTVAPALGFRVAGEGRSWWYPGDTGLADPLHAVARVDLALVPIGGWGPTLGDDHLDPSQAAAAVARVGATWALGVHYGTFWPIGLRRLAPGTHYRRFETPGDRFNTALRDHRIATALLRPAFGERLELPLEPGDTR